LTAEDVAEPIQERSRDDSSPIIFHTGGLPGENGGPDIEMKWPVVETALNDRQCNWSDCNLFENALKFSPANREIVNFPKFHQ